MICQPVLTRYHLLANRLASATLVRLDDSEIFDCVVLKALTALTQYALNRLGSNRPLSKNAPCYSEGCFFENARDYLLRGGSQPPPSTQKRHQQQIRLAKWLKQRTKNPCTRVRLSHQTVPCIYQKIYHEKE